MTLLLALGEGEHAWDVLTALCNIAVSKNPLFLWGEALTGLKILLNEMQHEKCFFSCVCLKGGDKIQDIAEEWKAKLFHLNEAVI